MSLSKNKTLLVTVADSNYIIQSKQLFASAYLAGQWPGDFMLITDSISNENRSWFETRGILVYEHPAIWTDEQWQKSCSTYKKIVSHKYFLFKMEFKQWKTIVYLDSDIIIKGPLCSLTKAKGFHAVHDAYDRLSSQCAPGYDPADFAKAGFVDLDILPFNTGFFVLDTGIIKSDSFDKLCQLTEQFLNYSLFGDQLILNLYFYKRWKLISPAYNLLINFWQAQAENALVLHFAGVARELRPWNNGSVSPYKTLWNQNLSRSESINYRSQNIKTSSALYTENKCAALTYLPFLGFYLKDNIKSLIKRSLRLFLTNNDYQNLKKKIRVNKEPR